MIYFDSAATTLQKPSTVAKAMQSAVQTMASPGRGGHPASALAAETVFRCREVAAELFDAAAPERIVFTMNATHALNLAIRTLVKPEDTVVISGYEHNAVTRPLNALNARIVTVNSPLFDPEKFLAELRRTLQTERPTAVVCTQMSNVFGYILPIEQVAALCRGKEIPLIVDASQSAGVLPLRVEDWGVAFAAMPGHKGLYGPQGTGILVCGQEQVTPLLYGGTGSISLSQSMPDFLPDRLEAGTQNVTGIAGLLAGLHYVKKRGITRIMGHEQGLVRRLAAGLERIDGIRIFYDESGSAQAGVLSFQVMGKDCEQVGEWLSARKIAVRAGLHCAPYAHRSAGTLEAGTVRVSFSAFNTEREVDEFLRIMKKLRRSKEILTKN